MGKYKYTEREQQLNQVLVYNQKLSAQTMDEQCAVRTRLDNCISTSEQLLAERGYGRALAAIQKKPAVRTNVDKVSITDLPDWSDLVSEAICANQSEVELEDILTQAEFQRAYQDLANIERQFAEETHLDKKDISFLIIATAIQTVRSVLFGQLSNHLSQVNSRLTDKEGDALVQDSKEKYKQQHEDQWESKKESQGRRLREAEGKTWKEIIFDGVPYDVIAGSKDLGLGLSGQNHRLKTLGHDPVLGWFFGTINILTDTITPAHPFISYAVKKINKKKTIVPPAIPYPLVIKDAVALASTGEHLLPASVFRQALHYKSDFYTKKGLPIPLLEVFSESIASKLYQDGYDSLQVLRKSNAALSAITAELFNMLIGLIHGLFFNPSIAVKSSEKLRAKERSLYEVRTRKILLISNSIATSSNVTVAALTHNPNYLDLGELFVTLSHLFTDIRFITRIKQEFIQENLDRELQEQLDELDSMMITQIDSFYQRKCRP